MNPPPPSGESGGSRWLVWSLLFAGLHAILLTTFTRSAPPAALLPALRYRAAVDTVAPVDDVLTPDPLDLWFDDRHGFPRHAQRSLPRQERPWDAYSANDSFIPPALPWAGISAPESRPPNGIPRFQLGLSESALGRLPTQPLPARSHCEFDQHLKRRWIATTPPTWNQLETPAPATASLAVLADGRVLQATLVRKSGVPAADTQLLKWLRQQRFQPLSLDGRYEGVPERSDDVTIGELEFQWAAGTGEPGRN